MDGNPALSSVESNLIPSFKKKFLLPLVIILTLLFLVGGYFVIQRFKLNPPQAFENYNVNKPQIIKQRIEHLNTFTPDEKEILTKSFSDHWPNANTERKKWGAYSNLYGSLWARYNVTKDETLKAEMSKIEGFMQQTWPSLYPAAVKGGNFLR